MKKLTLTIIAALTIFTGVYSQTKLDYLVLEKINEYRVEKGLNQVMWSDKSYKVSKYHNDYQFRVEKATHFGVGNMKTPSDRFKFYNIPFIRMGENILCTYVDEGTTMDDLATRIFNRWKNSPPHNKTLLGDYKYGSVSCGNSTICFSTMNFWSSI